MKPTPRIHDPFYNPFHNRFHAPVHSRPDEMQACTHMVWLNEPATLDQESQKDQRSGRRSRLLAGAFALILLVAFTATLLSI